MTLCKRCGVQLEVGEWSYYHDGSGPFCDDCCVVDIQQGLSRDEKEAIIKIHGFDFPDPSMFSEVERYRVREEP